jgi:transcriptional regulator with XRE-family HTH domain
MRQIGRRAERKRIADRLRAARRSSALTQEEAARKARVSRDTWNRIELGRAALPAERLVEFAAIVGVAPSALLGEVA